MSKIKCDILSNFQTMWTYLFLARLYQVFQEVILIHQWVIRKIHMEYGADLADEKTRFEL